MNEDIEEMKKRIEALETTVDKLFGIANATLQKTTGDQRVAYAIATLGKQRLWPSQQKPDYRQQ